jgi:hypothetical protein
MKKNILLGIALFSFGSVAFAQSSGQPQYNPKPEPVLAQPTRMPQGSATVQPSNPQPTVKPATGSATSTATMPATPQPATPSALKFETLTYDYGKITQGTVVNYKFKFTNTGTKEVKLENVRASCGCTTPNYPKEAIKPGATEGIDVRFDSAGKLGPQSKTVTVKTDEGDGGLIILTIKGEIIGSSNPAPAPTGK